MAEEREEREEGVVTTAPAANTKGLPEVRVEETADEQRFDCPQPWYLALLTVAMSMMTSITVTGALFFLLAAPEKVSPHCYERDHIAKRTLCTFSTVCFWTYPVVCCLFVVLVFAKNLVDQRLYYEFLLHKVIVGYGRNPAWKQPVVLMLLVYALCAFSALVWHSLSQTQIMVSHVYASLAYITPIISFLAVILAQWSIQGKLVTLPNFLEDYGWALNHLNTSRSYYVDDVHAGYNALELALDRTDDNLDTPRMVALVAHYTREVVNAKPPEDVEASAAQTGGDGEPKAETGDTARVSDDTASKAQAAEVPKEYVYWQVRLLFNPRLQDERAQNFRNWALAYMVSVILAILLSVYLYVCCFITCLEIERVFVPGTSTYAYTHYFSLRPDLGHSSHKSLKQVAATAALSFLHQGARSFYGRGVGALAHFQVGAAA